MIAINRRARLSEWVERLVPLHFTIAWIVVGLALNLSRTWLYQTLWVLMLAPLGLHAFWGAGQTIIFLAMMITGRKGVRAPLVVMLAGLGAFYFGSPVLNRWGDQVAFVFLRPAFDRVVADAPPGLIVFAWTEGIPDGGSAIVYDETDVTAGISPRTWEQASPELGKLLNGSPNYCVHFASPHYYLCGFG